MHVVNVCTSQLEVRRLASILGSGGVSIGTNSILSVFRSIRNVTALPVKIKSQRGIKSMGQIGRTERECTGLHGYKVVATCDVH